MTVSLPIEEIIPALKSTLSNHDNVVLQAPPGAGKTTAVPLALLDEPWLGGKKIIMLEPRRLAALAAARRMADMLGETVGETVGYRVRMQSEVGPQTRIEIVTEGVLIRKLQRDAELTGVGLVIFDEFHERSIQADLGLALSLDIQSGLRGDLKIMVMSATLDGERISALMDNAPIISSAGRSYNVEKIYLEKTSAQRIEDQVVQVILTALEQEQGSILVFLPGAREIERTRKILQEKQLAPNVMICPLYGMMDFKDQSLAISAPARGQRKIVLSTAIAETSLTIEGIRIVIDSGLQRISEYDAKSGMARLVSYKLSKASADQRAGRAGRLEQGICHRLWTAAAHNGLKPHTDPEITRGDLMPLVLSLADWGVANPQDLRWLDVPDKAAFNQGQELLFSLGALDHHHLITGHGKKMAEFAMHPRLAHMVLKADQLGHGALALIIAALIVERDLLKLSSEQRSADLRLRIEALIHVKNGQNKQARQMGCDLGVAKTILKQTKQWQRLFKISDKPIEIDKAGLCLSFAFPDRIGVARDKAGGIYLLSGGRGARLMDDDPLMRHKYLSVGHLDKGQRDARVFLAAPITRDEVTENFAHLIHKSQTIGWDDRSQSVKALDKLLLGATSLSVAKLDNPDPDQVGAMMVVGIRKMGLQALPWDKESIIFKKRVLLLNEHRPQSTIDFSDTALLATLESWLLPYLGKISSRSALVKLDLPALLKNILSWQQRNLLDQLVPTHFKVPSGSNILINYEGDSPVLSVKLQEMFGAVVSPKILEGSLNLTIELLSPARRPLQITSDLGGFWHNSYPEIKKEMKGRYPKHPWPDDPLSSAPTKKLKAKK